MSQKLSLQLTKPMPASHDCLPHAALNLGSARGLRPRSELVHRLVIQEHSGNWVLYRMDANGGFVGDTWHPTREDALNQAAREFEVQPDDFKHSDV